MTRGIGQIFLVFKMFTLVFLLLSLIASTQAWSGHLCSRAALKYTYETYCSCRTLWWCCGNSGRFVPYYTTVQVCCPGWKHNGDQNCSIPICAPECRNGGQCVNPNTCECGTGYEGDICDGTASCSHLDPCYPGICQGHSNISETTTVSSANDDVSGTNSSQCMCLNGFDGPTCLLISDDHGPVIEQSIVTFTKKQNSDSSFISENKADATDKTEVDVTWTNENGFNIIECFLHTTFDPAYTFGLMPRLPDYIRNTSYGIVNGQFEIIHSKINLNGGTTVFKQNLSCPEASRDNPLTELKCDIEEDNAIQLASGDVYAMTFVATTGGYRVLVNTDTDTITRTDYYIGPTTSTGIEFRFDYDAPVHCSTTNTTSDLSACGNETSMQLEKDITKEAIMPRWEGWSDILAGVSRYVFEVWMMKYSEDESGLKEPEITTEFNPKPLYIVEIMANNITFPMYKPNEPGIYSCILEINDRANNSEYVRRIVIYDNSSMVNTSETKALYVSTASSDANFMWQTTFSEDGLTQVNVSWQGHFFNPIHEEGHFLANVLKYEARLSDPNNPKLHDYKRILTNFDDNEGERTISSIPNIHSIVKFEITNEHITAQRTEPAKSNWRTISPLQEKDSFDLPEHTLQDGHAVQVWVKAYDIMNTMTVDTTVVRFDKSPPDLYTPEIDFNIDGGLTTRITVRSKDDHSGLKKLSFRFILNSTGDVRRATDDIVVVKQTDTECPPSTNPDCYCVQDDCFTKKFIIFIDNCRLTVPINTIKYEQYRLDVMAYNNAMLTTSVTKEIGSVLQFAGMQQYSSPYNLTVVGRTDVTITIQWLLLPTCYERIRHVIVIKKSDSTTKEFKVEKDLTEYIIPNLESSVAYIIEMYSDYGNKSVFVQSEPFPGISASTMAPTEAFPMWGFYSIGGGFFFILMFVVVVLLVLGRMGKLQNVKKRVGHRMSQFRNTWYNINRQPDCAGRKGNNNRAVSHYFDNDVHFFGDMQFEGKQHWHIQRRDISLEEELARGKFAIIFKAKHYVSKNTEDHVVAKTLQEDYTEPQKTEMMAKINFYATKIGHHVNVLEFKGSVEDEARGDMMVLEYCKNGTLKQYLQTVRECFDTEIADRLARIAYGICLGMDYLASRDIVHRRLAARNILLNHLFEAKVAGFGPEPEEQLGINVNPIHENVPVKWVAPECITSSDNATELSDAWSFGVVLWEIFSLGETPYPGINSSDIQRYLKDGSRMKKPEYCEAVFFSIMKKCWQYDVNRRYGFTKLKDQLRPLFHQGEGDDIYMDLIKDDTLNNYS